MGKRIQLCLIILSSMAVVAQVPRSYNMDELATCGRRVTVDDAGVRLNGRGNTAPSNPPTECIVYLQSSYALDDGSNKLQIKVEALNIQDCNVKVDLYNGHTSVGNTLQSLGCQYSSTGLIYSTGRTITVRFSRPDRLVHNEYLFTLEIKPFKDQDVPGTTTGVDTLSVGAIIGITMGCLVLVALIILFLWCCCTGRLGNFSVPGRPINKPVEKRSRGVDNAAILSEKSKPSSAINFQDPVVWKTVTTGKYEPQQQPGMYQKAVPRNMMLGRRFENDRNYSRRSQHDYEPYEHEQRQNEANHNYQNQRKETLIDDDVFDSDSATKDSVMTDNTHDDATLQKRSPRGSPKGSPKAGKRDIEVPEEEDMDNGSPLMQRYLSMDLQSQPDQDTISSNLHINAGVRASVDDEMGSPTGSLKKKKKKGDKSPKLKRRDGKDPDPMAMPPEAFEPIFTAPIAGIDYKSNQPQYGSYPGGFMPYGLIPAGAFAPGPPGTQTYAYAYQTAPPGGMAGQPYTQGAFIVQNTPTNEGNRRTAFAVEEIRSPDKSRLTPESRRRKNDPFKKTPYRDNDRSLQIRNRPDDQAPDLSIITRGAAPPDPGQAHRSIAMKSGTDPKNGIHTTQVVWTDTVADPTDPRPDENPQITRKTITRVTAKSGYGELPPQTNLLALEESEPDFLSPSRSRSNQATTSHPAILPATRNRSNDNIAYYTGDTAHQTVGPPERSSTPSSMHNAPSYNIAIRDRIPLDDATV